MSTSISVRSQPMWFRAAPARFREIAILVLWTGAACLWWSVTPGLLGMEISRPVLVSGLASAVPLLALRVAFWIAESARGARPLGGLPRLAGPTFTALLVVAFLCAALVMSYVLGIHVAASVALISVSVLGFLGATALVSVLVIATTEPTGRSLFEGRGR